MSEEKRPVRKDERQTGIELKERTKTKRPAMYRVLLHNDDYTTKEFVVWLLTTLFHRSESDATAIMNHVHHKGAGVAGIYTFEVAETKVTKGMSLARAAEFPLQLTMEPEDAES